MEPTYLGGGLCCDYLGIATSSLLCAYSLFSVWLHGSHGPFDAISLRTHHLCAFCRVRILISLLTPGATLTATTASSQTGYFDKAASFSRDVCSVVSCASRFGHSNAKSPRLQAQKHASGPLGNDPAATAPARLPPSLPSKTSVSRCFGAVCAACAS